MQPIPRDHAGFVEEIFKAEQRLLPELRISSDRGPNQVMAGVECSFYHIPGSQLSSYMYFAPSYFADIGMLSPDLIRGLRDGRRLLSVGAGPALLERFLAAHCKTQEGQIVLTDISEEVLPSGLSPRFVFDATRRWPDMGRFDYVLFPESFAICLRANRSSPQWDITKIRTESPGSLSTEDQASAFPDLKTAHHLLCSGLKHTSENGELRASYFVLRGDEIQMPYLLGLLRKKFGDLARATTQTENTLILRRGSPEGSPS